MTSRGRRSFPTTPAGTQRTERNERRATGAEPHDSGGRTNQMDPALTVDWFKQRTNYYMQPEMQQAGERAEVLHLRAKSYCADRETGGFVPTTMLPMLTPNGWKQRAAALVTVGVWVAVQGGYRIVDWDEDQAELEAYAARLRSDRERKRAQRERDKAAAEAHEDGGQSEGESPDMSRDCHVNVRAQEKEKRVRKKASPSSTARKRAAADDDPPPPPDPDTAARDQLAREVLGWWWDQLETKPAGRQAWHASLRVVSNLLAVGHEAKAVAAAARSIGTPLTTARMEIELGKMRTAASPNGHGPRPSTTDQRVQAGLDLAAKYAERDGVQLPALFGVQPIGELPA